MGHSRTHPEGHASHALEALVQMVISSGGDAANVAATLLELPDSTVAPRIPLQTPTLFLSAAASANLTNGTIETARSAISNTTLATIAGGHFDFLTAHVTEIVERIHMFYASL